MSKLEKTLSTAIITATSPEDAEQLLYEQLQNDGIDNLEYRCNDRDYGAQDAEEIE